MEREQTTIRLMTSLALIALLSFASPQLNAASEVLEFSDSQQEQRYLDLIDELRCMVCQNQNLADSNAGLAQDLRERTYQMVRSGKSEDEVIEYMVARYGDFVMYRPPLKSSTYLLWFGPLIFLLLSGATFILYSRRSRKKAAVKLSPADQEKARRLLDN